MAGIISSWLPARSPDHECRSRFIDWNHFKVAKAAVGRPRKGLSGCKVAHSLVKRDAGPLAWGEIALRRRQFLLTGLASALVTSAATAQEQKADAELDLAPVKGTEELWYLLTALDTLIFCMSVAVIKDQAVIVEARREVQPYTSQLSDPKAEEAFNAALKSCEGQARIEQNKAAISDAAKEIDALLTDVVSPSVRASVVHAFARSSTLLIARAAENQSWWCRVYAFRKVRC